MYKLKFAFRQLVKNPAFSAIVILTLALGIGANTALFSFVNAVLFRPLPFKEPERLVMMFTQYLPNDSHKNFVSAPSFEAWRKQSTSFEGLAARGYTSFVLTGKGQPENIQGARFSANICQLLGVRPALGRGFLPEEETRGRDRVVLLSHELWQRRFGGEANVVGQSVMLNDEAYSVIGVLPQRMFFPERDTQFWTPLAFGPEELSDFGSHNYLVYGRLKPNVEIAQANAEMNVVSQRLAGADERYKGSSAEIISLREILVGDSRTVLLVLLGAVGLVLLISCVNIANLLLARSSARAREFAIRAALGADRRSMIQQLLTENLLMAALGGIGGLIAAQFGLQMLIRLSPAGFPQTLARVHLDGMTLAFTAIVTLAAGLIFGLAPALQSARPNVAADLSESSRGSSDGRRRLRETLVVSEVALSLTLLIGAGLMLKSFGRLVSQSLGYNPEHVVTMDFGLPWRKYPALADQVRFFSRLKEQTEALPGVQSVGLVRGLPLRGQNTGMSIGIPGAPAPLPGESWDADYAQVSPGYFQTMNIPLLMGRDFNTQDRTNTTPVTIVNESFAKQFKLGTNVIGRVVNFGGVTNIEIVGVVKDSKRSSLANFQRAAVFRTFQQQCWGFMSLVVRTQRDPAEIANAIRAELDTIDKDQPIDNVRTMTQLVESSVADRRLPTRLLGAFAAVAALLAALGIYGVLAFNVARRTREIGIRMALGAPTRQVLAMIIRHGMKLALIGTIIGTAGALAFTRVMGRMLYEVKPTDPLTFVCVSAFLLAIGLLASWLPARRATRINPLNALHAE